MHLKIPYLGLLVRNQFARYAKQAVMCPPPADFCPAPLKPNQDRVGENIPHGNHPRQSNLNMLTTIETETSSTLSLSLSHPLFRDLHQPLAIESNHNKPNKRSTSFATSHIVLTSPSSGMIFNLFLLQGLINMESHRDA